jgi:elongation factor G
MQKGDRLPPIPPKLTAVGQDDEGDKGQITVTKNADGEGKFIRGSEEHSQYGHVVIRVEPNGRGKGVIIVSEVNDDTIPSRFIEPIKAGIRKSLENGIDGRSVVDIVIRISGGSWSNATSEDLAFKMAGIFALKDAVRKAEPIGVEQSS